MPFGQLAIHHGSAVAFTTITKAKGAHEPYRLFCDIDCSEILIEAQIPSSIAEPDTIFKRVCCMSLYDVRSGGTFLARVMSLHFHLRGMNFQGRR